mgnify:CR=1 FL=1
MSERRVLLTGAAGFVGGILRSHWADRYSLRLSSIRNITDPEGHETVKTDITDFGQFLAACDGVGLVVHLAADPSMQAKFMIHSCSSISLAAITHSRKPTRHGANALCSPAV